MLLMPLALIAALETASVDPAAVQANWAADRKLLADTQDAIRAGGIAAVGPRAKALSDSLAHAVLTIQDGDTLYVLTDGTGEALVAGLMAGKTPGVKKEVSLDNPYPAMALYLGSYDDEMEKFADAVRALDRGLALDAVEGMSLGETRLLLLVERGAALNQLRRFDDALADFAEGLKTDDMEPSVHARLLRGRGYTYTELGRLDDAEADYKLSLQLEPGNPVARQELDYIAGLRHGAMPAKGAMAPLKPQTPAGDSTPH